MMQFYKMQWETQQERTRQAHADIDTLERANKRQCREIDHKDRNIRVLNDMIHEARFDNETMQTRVNGYAEANAILAESEYRNHREAHLGEVHNINLLMIIGRIFEENDEIKHKYLRPIQDEINRVSIERGLPTLESQEEIETEPDSDIEDEPQLI